MSKKAPFITFEGGEGSGKSTQIKRLEQRLLDENIPVACYREPGGTFGAEEIRALLVQGDPGRWTPKTEALLMSAARAELVERRLVPHLEKGEWVLCDRFNDSTLAYQGVGHGLGYDNIKALNTWTVGNLNPDLTFIFQIPLEISLERARIRSHGQDRFESFDIAFHQQVQEGYAKILQDNPKRCVAIDASLEKDVIEAVIFKEIKERFLGLD